LNNREEDGNIIIVSDRHRIKQILVNLLNNACKFTEKGFVELGCEIKDEELTIYVKDTGVGISEANMKVIFDRFRKITDDKNKLFRGAGLGLAISQKYANLCGGKLMVESQLGLGSTFYYSLPISEIAKE